MPRLTDLIRPVASADPGQNHIVSSFSSEPSPTAELVDRVIHGDRRALAELFELYRDRLRKIVRFRLDHRLAARVDVEDVLQEAYLNAQDRLQYVLTESTGDGSGGLFVWFRLIVGQTLVDIHRRHLGAQARDAGRERTSRDANASSSVMSSWLFGHLTSPSQAMLRKELTEQLETALDSMSELDRDVLVMRHFEELTNQESARVLGISEQAASVRYVRALKRLQNILVAIPGFVERRPT
ncbi:MAG: sigma-70 family RNA polymerase sigma factor [Planctomycetales bacterium]|nr:sigma-70 family RNA polymerase sigma factor [Planctomycetales bacterium]